MINKISKHSSPTRFVNPIPCSLIGIPLSNNYKLLIEDAELCVGYRQMFEHALSKPPFNHTQPKATSMESSPSLRCPQNNYPQRFKTTFRCQYYLAPSWMRHPDSIYPSCWASYVRGNQLAYGHTRWLQHVHQPQGHRDVQGNIQCLGHLPRFASFM